MLVFHQYLEPGRQPFDQAFMGQGRPTWFILVPGQLMLCHCRHGHRRGFCGLGLYTPPLPPPPVPGDFPVYSLEFLLIVIHSAAPVLAYRKCPPSNFICFPWFPAEDLPSYLVLHSTFYVFCKVAGSLRRPGTSRLSTIGRTSERLDFFSFLVLCSHLIRTDIYLSTWASSWRLAIINVPAPKLLPFVNSQEIPGFLGALSPAISLN